MTTMTFASLPSEEKYEVIDCRCTAGAKSSFLLRFSKSGVVIKDRPYSTEIGARKEFEKRCEGKSI